MRLALLLAAIAAPARADVTAFIGANTTPANRQVRGARARLRPARSSASSSSTPTRPTIRAPTAPSLKTGMGNMLLQTPVRVLRHSAVLHDRRRHLSREARRAPGHGLRPEHRRRREGLARRPVRLRVDYRVFKLGSGALNSPAHRIYAGLNLKF